MLKHVIVSAIFMVVYLAVRYFSDFEVAVLAALASMTAGLCIHSEGSEAPHN